MFRAVDRWLWPYLTRHRLPPSGEVLDVLLCVCDHFEPHHAADAAEARRRVAEWQETFPALSEPFRDADGRSPAHTFFYPIEQYDADIVEALKALCRASHAEVEVHLHHDGDTAESLLAKLEEGKVKLRKHGLLSQDRNGAVRFGFIHGDWALDDSHPSGRHCGVRNELDVLMRGGCYADFTMPSAPDSTQTRTINSIYYAEDSPAPKSHDHGRPMRVLPTGAAGRNSAEADPPTELLLVQGPLGLNWGRRKFGVLPRIENGEISGANAPTRERLALWLSLGIHVLGRPEWRVVKLHTHGGLPRNMSVLLGKEMERFYSTLPGRIADGRALRYHFVTARELVNILHAAEAGHSGNPGDFRDFCYTHS
ncbi:MAG: hypothetical protein HOJ57_13940 [Lentisphaerae bacterium]|jgi:hypothetical protein|nr:hypothetical protein [Lentisphaerota bacterium]MBT5607036.1 hypothetical protein [Lentisphaerota bacterium]MBT7055790.1 hypothetical protein [Lentisphaerota bacterium]